MTEWSTTISTGTSGLILAGSPPSSAQGVAHGGQVDHPGHAGQVLHQHPFGGEGDLGGVGAADTVALGVDPPTGDGLDVGRR